MVQNYRFPSFTPDCGLGLRHFLRTCFIHAVSPLTPVRLICFGSGCVLFPASLCKIPSLLGVGRLGVTFLFKGRVFTFIYISVQGTYSFLSIIPWMPIRFYFLEVPGINKSHLLKPHYLKSDSLTFSPVIYFIRDYVESIFLITKCNPGFIWTRGIISLF